MEPDIGSMPSQLLLIAKLEWRYDKVLWAVASGAAGLGLGSRWELPAQTATAAVGNFAGYAW